MMSPDFAIQFVPMLMIPYMLYALYLGYKYVSANSFTKRGLALAKWVTIFLIMVYEYPTIIWALHEESISQSLGTLAVSNLVPFAILYFLYLNVKWDSLNTEINNEIKLITGRELSKQKMETIKKNIKSLFREADIFARIENNYLYSLNDRKRILSRLRDNRNNKLLSQVLIKHITSIGDE